MPTSLSLTDHLGLIAANADALVADARQTEFADLVPSCPLWSLADLVAHVGGVHRWATAIVSQARTENLTDAEESAVMTAPAAPGQLLAWFADGSAALLESLRAAPEDLQALVFLRNAPPPRQFWARRQAHETAIHRVDVLAARLGGLPTAAQAGIGAEHAIDGIDELLTGFVPRRSSKLRSDSPISISVTPTDSDAAWTVLVSADPPVTTIGADPDAGAALSGTAAALYLGLWNRGDEIVAAGDPEALGLWRERVRVSWA